MNEDLFIPKIEPKEFTISDNYIIVPTLELELINDELLRFYKTNNINIKLRLHSKSEYEFNGKIIEINGMKEYDSNCVIPSIYCWHKFYIILKDDKDNKIKLFFVDIDHRTIMPKDVQAVKPLLIFERESIPIKLRFEVLGRDNHTCQYCGKKPPEVTLEIDHIIPVSKGGLNDKANLITSCRDCNIGKSNKL